MRVIKCDICKKELKPEECIEEYSYIKKLDLCSECSTKFKESMNYIRNQERILNREYEEKRKRIYESVLTKYDLNKE